MLVVYFVDFGVTSIVVPVQLRPYLGDILDLGTLRACNIPPIEDTNGSAVIQAGCITATCSPCPSSPLTV